MNAKERYYFNHHAHRLLLWQIATAERARAERIRNIRRAWKAHQVNRALAIVRADSLKCFENAVRYAQRVGI